MRHILTAILLGFYFIAQGQSETHDFITYDTVMNVDGTPGNPGLLRTFTLRISRPRNMFTVNNPDTASRPLLLTMPGDGQVGTDTNNLVVYGPHYWLNNGWDGSVVLGNGTHYPIIITYIPPGVNYRPWYIVNLIDTIRHRYHVLWNSIHYAGLSDGGFTGGRLINYRRTSTTDDYAQKLIKSFVSLEGNACDSFNVYSRPNYSWFGHWVGVNGGRYFALEGTTDTRNLWAARDTANNYLPGQCYFAYENIGGGAHCCWNSMYDPSATNWNSVTPPALGPNIATNANHPNSMGTYKSGWNVFQWMLRQGDTTLIGGCGPIVDAGNNQSFYLPQNSTTLTGTATYNCGHTSSIIAWTRVSGPNTPTIVSPSSLSTSVTGLIAGTYVFQLMITDNNSLTSSDNVMVTVNAEQSPTVSAGSNQTLILPTTSYVLQGSATGNGGATITSTTWSQLSGPNTASFTDVTILQPTVSGMIVGAYVFQLSALDNNGNSNSASVTITITPAGTPIVTNGFVGMGEYQTFFIDDSGHVQGIGGAPAIGAGGVGGDGIPHRLAVTPFNLKFKWVAGTLHAGLAVDTAGHVWTWGENPQGQLGIGTADNSTHSTPTMITTDSLGNPFDNVVQVFAAYSGGGNGHSQSFALKGDGTLWIWGWTKDGLRGDGSVGDSTTRPIQVPVPGGRKVVQALAGTLLICLMDDSTVWTTGGGSYNNATGVTTIGNVQNLGYAATGNQYLSLHQITGFDAGVTQIAGGINFNYALTSKGHLYGWGFNGDYLGGSSLFRPGTPTKIDSLVTNKLDAPIRFIGTNSVGTHIITTNGTLWYNGDEAVGNGGDGQVLNFATYTINPAPTGGTPNPYAWDLGTRELMQVSPVQVTHLNDFTAVFGASVFTFYTYALSTSHGLMSCGENKGGPLVGGGINAPTADIIATYRSSWVVPNLTSVNPIALTTTITSTSPYCILNPGGSPCNEYSIPANPGPTANAGPDQNITTSFTDLNGSASSDNVKIAYYLWKQISGPTTATIVVPSDINPHITGLANGTYTFQLTVTDNGWSTSTDTVVINVGNVTNCNCITTPTQQVIHN